MLSVVLFVACRDIGEKAPTDTAGAGTAPVDTDTGSVDTSDTAPSDTAPSDTADTAASSVPDDFASADFVLEGVAVGDWAGSNVRAVGDVNGDGDDDLLVGAMCAEGDPTGCWNGSAYLLYGPVTASRSLSSADATYTWAIDDLVGRYGESAGDVDGDGLADLLLGVPAGYYGNRGNLAVVYGPAASVSINAADVFVQASAGEAFAGVFGADDLDGDGLSDVMVGASTTGVLLYTAPTPTTARGDAVELRCSGDMGTAAARGDLNGDGLEDVALGCVSDDAAFVFYGPITSNLGQADADVDLSAEAAGDGAGSLVRLLPDLGGDGLDDLAVGAYFADGSAGVVYLLEAPATGSLGTATARLSGTTAGDWLGWQGLSEGDVDGDGNPDLLLGGGYAGSDNAGAAWLLYGPFAGSVSVSTGRSWSGSDTNAYAGFDVTLHDLDSDGLSDVLIGVPGPDASAGAAYAFWGAGL